MAAILYYTVVHCNIHYTILYTMKWFKCTHWSDECECEVADIYFMIIYAMLYSNERIEYIFYDIELWYEMWCDVIWYGIIWYDRYDMIWCTEQHSNDTMFVL